MVLVAVVVVVVVWGVVRVDAAASRRARGGHRAETTPFSPTQGGRRTQPGRDNQAECVETRRWEPTARIHPRTVSSMDSTAPRCCDVNGHWQRRGWQHKAPVLRGG